MHRKKAYKAMTRRKDAAAVAPARELAAPAPSTLAPAVHPGEKTQMTNDDAQRIASEVLVAFDELTQKHGGLVISFSEAFNDRTKIPGLSESRGGLNGLTDVLADLLRTLPPASVSSPDSNGATFGDEAFKKRFERALRKVADEYPRSLILMERHRRETGRSLSELLAELFQLYVDDKEVIPY